MEELSGLSMNDTPQSSDHECVVLEGCELALTRPVARCIYSSLSKDGSHLRSATALYLNQQALAQLQLQPEHANNLRATKYCSALMTHIMAASATMTAPVQMGC